VFSIPNLLCLEMQSHCCGYGHDEGQCLGPDYTFLMVLECIIGHPRDSKLEHAGVFNAREATCMVQATMVLELLRFRFGLGIPNPII
jgi:hypothetical protein